MSLQAVRFEQDLSGRPRSDQASACRTFLEEARGKIRAAHERGEPGDVTSRAYSDAIDQIVIALFRAARSRLKDALEPVSLVAVGGYGRGELCPFSDLDLWFVTEEATHRGVSELAEAVLYPLWDLKLEVGHAVRTPLSAVELGREDLTACTALLDTRFLDGDRAPFDRLRAEVPRLFERDPSDIVRRLDREKRDRHARFGDTVFLLEPNCKNGEGGYRDLLVGLWAAKARYSVNGFSDLTSALQSSPRQARALMEAQRFFLTLRTAAHFGAGRKADRLTFELQESIAPGLLRWTASAQTRPADDLMAPVVAPAVAPAVEALMQRYFQHAKAVKRETERLLERCMVEPEREPVEKIVDDSFSLVDDKLTARDVELFRRKPAEMLRIFNVAAETGAALSGQTCELIADAVVALADDQALSGNLEASAEFLRLLIDPRDRRSPSLLEQAHDLGLVAAMMPEFAPCTGRVQHDLYHVFTVDQHSLYAVGRLKEIERGELKESLPLASQVIGEVERRVPLYLGTLLHDVGKPLGKGHSETGAKLAVTIGRRLGLSEQDVSQTEFLVLRHLYLSHLSQRRDLNDVAMVAGVAVELGDEETLRELYLLTLADMSMVAPGNLTDWKEQLLRELYVRTLAHFHRGADLQGSDRSAVVARRKKRVAEISQESEAAIEAWFASLPDRYVTLASSKEIVRHLQLSHRRSGAVAIEVVHRARRGFSELTVCTEDAPGLLSRIAGVLLANRLDILSAQIHSRMEAGGKIEALDVFTVRDRYGRAMVDDKKWARFEADLAQVIEGKITVEKLIVDRRERKSLPDRVVPEVRTEIEVDNHVSNDFSVIDVYTQDRLGVLYTITRTLAELRLDIQLSKVSTEGIRVADVFYVRDRDRALSGKLSPERTDEVKLTLAETLGRAR